MADYFTPTVVQQTIPLSDITALERLLFCHIFEAEPDGDGLYFSSDIGPSDFVTVPREELEDALMTSPDSNSAAHVYVTERRAALASDNDVVELDLTGTSWEFFLQDIVKRSATPNYVTVVSAFTCSKMRADGFGGATVLITPEKIVGKSTHDILEDFLVEAGLAGVPAVKAVQTSGSSDPSSSE